MRRNVTFFTRKIAAIKIFCMLVALCVAGQAGAQTPGVRTTTLYTGSSPFQDSLWACNVAENSIVRRLGPTLTGFTITGITGLATDPTTGIHYAIVKVSGQPNNRKLATIDIQTGVCTEIGNLGDKFASLAFNANGSLFGATGNGAAVPETMFRINKADASNSIFRPLGAGADGEILAFCPDNNKFYHWSGNGTVLWERMDTTGVDVIESLTYSGTPGGETFGAIYIGGGKFLVSNISSTFRIWDTSGAIGPVLMSLPDDLRGLLVETTTSTITPSGPLSFCAGGSALLTVSPGTSNYQWYQNGVAISGATDATYSVTTSGVYNVIYTDMLGDVDSTPVGITVVVNPLPTIASSTIPDVCAGTTSALLSFSGVTNAISNTVTMGYTGGAQTWTVPAGVTSIVVDAQGAGGGENSDEISYPNRPGYGGRVQATLAVTPGQVLNIYVGGQGGNGQSLTGGTPGFNGGATGGFGFSGFSGGGGGGATDIRIGGTALSDRVLVAAGGGGAGLDCGLDFDRGGDGGGLTGEDGGGLCNGGNGGGGTSAAGGFGGVCGACSGANGMAGAFGIGGDGGVSSGGGGGGGGYYGGGGGQWDGSGGGSNYTDALLATSVLHTRGFNVSGGQVTITYSIPSTYSIVWDPAATTAGFANVTNSPVTSSPITVVVPGAATPSTYTGTFTINNTITGCSSASTPISLTINPIPDVTPVTSQIVCNGTSTTGIIFTGTLAGTTYNWTNSDPSIGIPTSGADSISAFIATNTSFVPVTAALTVTPVRLGCVGATQTFSITVNPTPDVAASSNQTVCNGSMTTSVVFTGSVAGTLFSWTNSNTSIGIGASGTDSIGSFTGIDTSTAPVTSVVTVNTSANGCTGSSNSFTITIDPTPVFTSALNPPSICNNTLFSYTPTSATVGTTYLWTRDTVTGISNAWATGADDPMEVLVNTTPNSIAVVYVYTLTASGCTNVQSVNVVVYPTPMLSSSLTPPAICDNTLFTYAHTSATAGTTFSWSRDFVPGISNPASSGVDTINEVLVNTTPNPISVTYVDTLTANGCINIQTIAVTVNPKPLLSSPRTLSPICDGSSILYVPTSLTTGTTFAWSRGTIAGISNPAASGMDTISETLNNTSTDPVTVTYLDTLRANGCMNIDTITIVVNPTPKLSSSLTPPGVCDSAVFNYTPMSLTTGSTFSWNRPFVLGIGLIAGTGTSNPNEMIINNTNDILNVVYVYTITANGCTNTQNVTLASYPKPTLSSPLSYPTCSGTNFHYVPTGYVFGTSFAWTRANVAGVKPSTGSGTGTINEVLTDTALVPFVTAYKFILTANGCTNQQYVIVTVNPTPPVLPITTHSPAELCSNTMYQNFGTSSLPPAGQQYHWTATNATVWATGTGGQYSLISFNNPGTAVVTLKSNLTGFACITNSSFTVNVGTGVSDMPKVVYFDNKQLICLQADEDSYQWGFDDAHTLDSTIIEGEKNPDYFISGPDFTNRYYWVITRRGDCMQKTYYNAPLGITTVSNAEVAAVKLYPNPTSDVLNVEINTSADGDYQVDIVNIVGQKIQSSVAVDRKARMSVSGLSSGCYIVECYRNGVKIAAQRFIKN